MPTGDRGTKGVLIIRHNRIPVRTVELHRVDCASFQRTLGSTLSSRRRRQATQDEIYAKLIQMEHVKELIRTSRSMVA